MRMKQVAVCKDPDKAKLICSACQVMGHAEVRESKDNPGVWQVWVEGHISVTRKTMEEWL
jgi:hypothetical protein